MKLLLDTHALFWWLKNDPKLSRAARSAIGDDASKVFVSAVSALEITSKVRIGKWPEAAAIAHSIETVVLGEGFAWLSITVEHAKFAGFIDSLHRDPFDRLLASQAIVDEFVVVTGDSMIAALGAETLW